MSNSFGVGAGSIRVQRPWSLATTTYFGTVNTASLAALFTSSRGTLPLDFIVNVVLWFFMYTLVYVVLVGEVSLMDGGVDGGG